MAEKVSCQGVWILSPSPQLKGSCTEVHGLWVHIPNPRGHTPGPYPQPRGPHNVCGLSVVLTI